MKNNITKIQSLASPLQSTVQTVVVSGFCVLAVFVGLYVYFVGHIVFDVVARRNAEVAIRNSQSAISSLEVSYFDKLKTITIAQAETVGLKESQDTLYASRTSVSATTVGMLQ